ncbi:hypothetical protein AB0F11_24975 [Streptomyces sp. NPDC032472]|uniref:hypothetical protein n=1 Tax=Streptomyces sp. NPDC032472 TaxID=3155018 RepID=UPI0033D97AC3
MKLEKYLLSQLRGPANYVDDASGARIIIDRSLRDAAGNPVVVIRQDHMIHAYHVEEKDISNYITPRDGKDAAKWRTPRPEEVYE